MKRFITILTMIIFAMIATQATADMVDGDFSSAANSRLDHSFQPGYIDTVNELNDGWYQAYSADWNSGDEYVEITPPNGVLGEPACIGQVFDTDDVAEYTQAVIQYDYRLDEAGTVSPASLQICIFGIKHNTHASNDGIRIGEREAYAMGVGDEHGSNLMSYTMAISDTGGWEVDQRTTVPLDITEAIDAGYHYLGLSIGGLDLTRQDSSGNTQVLGFDNVSIVQAPEPALLGFIAFGILALIRKNRQSVINHKITTSLNY